MIGRRTVLTTVPALVIAAATMRAAAAPARLLRVGFQKGEPILLAARQNRRLETLLQPLGIDVQWIEFEFGPPMLEAMRANAIDIGAVGDTPPVFAQAAHADLLYIAAQRAGGQAILVPPGSHLQTLQDLKGKKLAFGRGSSAHNLVLAALEKAGLKYTDIQPVYLGPADAGPAFERGAIDAWSIWDPYYALFETRPGVRVLAKSTGYRRAKLVLHRTAGLCRGEPGRDGEGCRASSPAIAEWARSSSGGRCRVLAGATGMPIEVGAARWSTAIRSQVLPMNDESSAASRKSPTGSRPSG